MNDAGRAKARGVVVGSGLALIFLSGLAHGHWTGRWGASRELEAAIAALDRVPAKFGDWQGRAVDVDPRQIAQAEIDGYVSRLYVDRHGGGAVQVLLVCGRPGPISVHTPDVCYRGVGFAPDTEPSLQEVRTGPRVAELRTATFRKDRPAEAQAIQIAWSWNAAGRWRAPDRPRLDFAPARALYKLYVVRELTSADQAGDDAACEAFLHQLLPILDEALFPGPGRSDGGPGTPEHAPPTS